MKSLQAFIIARLKSTKFLVISSFIIITGLFSLAPSVMAQQSPVSQPDGTKCSPSGSFLGVLEPWYAYVKQDFVYEAGICGFHTSFTSIDSSGNQSLNISGLDVVWLVGLAILDDLLRVAGLLAVGFVIYGGFRYITSQGEPENTKAALSTIINSLIGTAIVIIASSVVSFIGGALGTPSQNSGSCSNLLCNPLPTIAGNSTTIVNILNLVFTIAGALTLLFIVIGGFKYVTSGGEPQSTAKARNTIIYASVGLIVTLAASLIVNFVVGNL